MRERLWIGSFVDVETENQLKQAIQYKKPSTSLSQRNILEGMEQVSGQYFDCIGAVVMQGFPRDRKLFIPAVSFRRPHGKTGQLAGFCNLLYVNKLLTSVQLKRLVRKWIRKHKSCDGVDVFIYEARSACMAAAALVKKQIPNTRIHLIVPDLPCYMDLHMGGFKRMLKQLDWKQIQRYLPDMDAFILYTSAMAKQLGIQDKPWLLMEGSIQSQIEDQLGDLPEEAPDNTTCALMYSGSINDRFGITDLVEAVGQLGDGYELWITGMGPDAERVKAAAAQKDNVRYYGFLADQKDVMRMQAKAAALINMRDPLEEASNYCFPSKLFEYMLTGKPVLSCRLGGIPEEYFAYLIEMKSIAPEDIAQAIRKVAAMDRADRQKLGTMGREFVLTKKNNLVQAQRIVDFVNSIR